MEGRKVLVPLLKYPSTMPAAFRAWTYTSAVSVKGFTLDRPLVLSFRAPAAIWATWRRVMGAVRLTLLRVTMPSAWALAR